MSSDVVERSIERKFLSSDLIIPGPRKRVTLPTIGKFMVGANSRKLWGKEKGRKRSSSWPTALANLCTFDPSHKHYGTKAINMQSRNQPYQVTKLHLSNCRLNDERLPRVLDDAIPKRKIKAMKCLEEANPYFSHTSQTEVVPLDKQYPRIEQSIRGAHCTPMAFCPFVLSGNTLAALASANKNYCWTTTYTSSYAKPPAVNRSRLIGNKEKKAILNPTTFANNTKSVKKPVQDNEKRNTARIANTDAAVNKNAKPAPVVSFVEDRANVLDICRFCCQKKKLKGEPTCSTQCPVPSSKADLIQAPELRTQRRLTWPVGAEPFQEAKPAYPKIIIKGYNDKPYCPILPSNFCRCDRFPQLRNSKLKAEFLSKRHASSFNRRNWSTISVFQALKHDPKTVQEQLLGKGPISNIIEEHASNGQKHNYTSNAVTRTHDIPPRGPQEIRDSSKA